MIGKKILLATDGSAQAVCASRTAIELSNELGLPLHVVHVTPIPSAYAAQGELSMLDLVDPELEMRLRERAERKARERLDEQVQKIQEAGGKVSEGHLKVGRPDVEIVRLAEELDAGLVVVGNRGWGPFKRDALGSVCDSVVRHASCPVLVVRDGEEDRAERSSHQLRLGKKYG